MRALETSYLVFNLGSVTGRVDLGRLHTFSVPLFSHLQNGPDVNGTCLIGLF